MPFITQELRKMIDSGDSPIDIQPGERCYKFYSEMVKRWKASPRWTTAHEIYRDVDLGVIIDEDDWIAQQLAWQVFFQLYVMPYELKKREENGDI